MLSEEERISSLSKEERRKLAEKAVEAIIGKSRGKKRAGRRSGRNRK
jgi:hypothetical protein